MSKTIVLSPLLSEKTYAQAQDESVYAFRVPRSASKQSIAQAVSDQFEVSVVRVNVSNVKGKSKRTILKRSRPVAGKRADTKKAYVTLKEGEKLPFFEAEQEKEKKQEKVQAQAEKAAQKAAKKAEKEAK